MVPPFKPDGLPNNITIYIDADACPVKQVIYRVAERHALKGTALKVLVVTNSPITVPREEMIERVVVGAGMDEAANWIAERAGAGAIVITADVPLASRAVKSAWWIVSWSGCECLIIGEEISFANTADNTTRRGPAVCRAAAEEDCRQTSRRSDQRTHHH